MIRVACILLLIFFGPAQGFSREGYVRTRNGTVIEGRVRFESNAVIVVNLAQDAITQIAWSNVAAVGMEPMPPSDFETTPLKYGPLADPWSSADIGSVRESGSAQMWDGGFRIVSAGTNVFGQSDSFHFVYKPVHGDSQLIGRVMALDRTKQSDLNASAGQMGLIMRENLGAEARQVAFMLSSRYGARLGGRERPATPAQIIAEHRLPLPQWIKISRVDHTVSAFCSKDGRQWKVFGRAQVEWPEDILVGVAVTGKRDASVAAEIQHVREGQSLANEWFLPQVRLVGGSVQAGQIDSLDDTNVRFTKASPPAVPTKSVANIRFRPLSARVARQVNNVKTGVYLPSGEFVAGDIRGIHSGVVTLSSVPLGLLRFDIGAEVMVVVLRAPGPIERRPCRLTTYDGSRWLASTMDVEGDWVVLRDVIYGIRRVPVYTVTEMEWI